LEDTIGNPDEDQNEVELVEPINGLFIRHVEDRGLPATVVLPELSEDRGSQGPVPIFVP
jgi:hypothetical protein